MFFQVQNKIYKNYRNKYKILILIENNSRLSFVVAKILLLLVNILKTVLMVANLLYVLIKTRHFTLCYHPVSNQDLIYHHHHHDI